MPLPECIKLHVFSHSHQPWMWSIYFSFKFLPDLWWKHFFFFNFSGDHGSWKHLYQILRHLWSLFLICLLSLCPFCLTNLDILLNCCKWKSYGRNHTQVTVIGPTAGIISMWKGIMYADNTTLMAESKEELKSLLMRLKEK